MRIRATISLSEFEELIRPKLKLFLSVDVVGSTDFKQRAEITQAHRWLDFFVSFYRDFPDFLDAAVAERGCNGTSLPRARLWKSLGDELIFTVELKSRHQAEEYLKAFSLSLQRASDNWRMDNSKSGRKELRLKGTAWIAGFPVTNAEIPLELTVTDGSDGRDYIGPQIDTGFRLKDFATPRKLVLSADLAYLIVSASSSDLRLFFDGDQIMRGVLRGKPYPVVWIDCDGHHVNESPRVSAKMNQLKDKLTGKVSADPHDLKQYLAFWMEDNHGRIKRPFIRSDLFNELRVWDDYEGHYQTVTDNLRGLFMILDDAEKNATAGDEKVPEGAREFLEKA